MRKYKKKLLSIVRVIATLLLLSLILVAFYLAFMSSKNKKEALITNEISKKTTEDQHKSTIEYIEKTKKVVAQTCIDNIYLQQKIWIDELQHNLLTKKEILPLLSVATSIFFLNDTNISAPINTLNKIFANNKIYNLDSIQEEYKEMRYNVIKEFYLNKHKNSIILKYALQIVKIHKVGVFAIESGEPESTLEIGGNYLKEGKIKESIDAIKTLYLQNPASQNWLNNYTTYLKAKESIDAIRKYIDSDKYKQTFIRSCR